MQVVTRNSEVQLFGPPILLHNVLTDRGLPLMTERIPQLPAFFEPLLRVLSQHPGGIGRKDISEPVADLMGLTAAQRAESLPSGKLRYRHRMGWAFHGLKHAGFAQSVGRGVWGITEDGARFLRERPQGLTEADRREISRHGRSSPGEEDDAQVESLPPGVPNTDPEQTPEERIDAAIDAIRREVSRELLELIGQSSPAFFETLVLDLLHSLGYGTGRHDLQRVGASGDGGIDGIIALDKLGLEKVYVQAKRWQGNVGRPDVQGFYGALAGRRARKGVFITTSSYTREAKEFAASVSDSVVLVDGPLLARLMIDHGVGVNHNRAVIIPSIDNDYFEET